MRPDGPEPWTRPRSIPRSFASFFASGETNTRPPRAAGAASSRRSGTTCPADGASSRFTSAARAFSRSAGYSLGSSMGAPFGPTYAMGEPTGMLVTLARVAVSTTVTRSVVPVRSPST